MKKEVESFAPFSFILESVTIETLLCCHLAVINKSHSANKGSYPPHFNILFFKIRLGYLI